MNKSNNNIIKKYGLYIIAFILPIIILLLLFYIKNVYPFGTITISNGDMGQAYLPTYYNLWDIFYNKAFLFFNTNLGGGSNIFWFGSMNGLYDPIDWLVVLSSRDHIPYMMSYILIIKIACISLTSSIMFRYFFKKTDNYLIILFSLLYAFSGIVISYHTIMPWLHIYALFPILVIGIKKLFIDKKPLTYIITLFFISLLSVYLTYFILLFLIFASFIYMHIFVESKDKKKFIFLLGISTVIPLGLSLFSTLPTLNVMLTSYRFDSAGIMINKIFPLKETALKILIMCFYGFPFIYLIRYLFTYKNNKKEVKFLFLLLLMLTISIVLEPINVLWQAGSYFEFPYRYAFIPTLLIYMGALRYIDKNGLNIKELKSKLLNIFGILITLGLTIIIPVLYYYIIKMPIMRKGPSLLIPRLAIITFIIIFLISFIISFLIFKLKINKKTRYLLLSILIIIQIMSNCYFYIGIDRNKIDDEFGDKYAFLSNELYEFGKTDNTLYKYSDIHDSLLENYPFIINKPALSTWSLVEKDQVYTHLMFGYSHDVSKLKDIGGSIFSNQLLGINRFFTKGELKGNDYKLIGGTNSFNIYEYKKALPVGLLYRKRNDLNVNLEDNHIDNINKIYQGIFDKTDNILEKVDYKEKKEGKKQTLTFHVDKKSYLYFEASDIKQIDISNLKFKEYEIRYNYKIGTLYMGIFEDEDLEIELNIVSGKELNFNLYTIEYDKMWDLINNYRQDKVNISIDEKGINIKTNINEDKSLFLPITYNEGLYAYSDKGTIPVNKVAGNYISLDLSEGDNDIYISYIPKGLKLGTIISIISVIAFVLLIINKNKFYSDILANLMYYGYFVATILIFLYIYIFWIFYEIIKLFIQIH